MRILIVGAGIAGLTLAALLKQRGLEVTIIEKAPNFDHAGYMLALYPISSRVLHGLHYHEQFISNSQMQNSYFMYDGFGKIINRYDFAKFVTERYGSIQMLMRGDLLRMLQAVALPKQLLMNTTLKSLKQENEEVIVEFSNGEAHRFDLVVGADGIHSQVRDMVFSQKEIQHLDTGWGGWLWFVNDTLYARDQVSECWGNGYLVGAYPTKDKVGIIAAMPNKKAHLDAPHAGRKAMLKELCLNALAALPKDAINSIPEDNQDMFYWRLKDVRVKNWAKGRVVLLGDASTAFLPTAGLGASMAMESAAVLADELSRSNARYVESAIHFYIKRRQARTEKAQTASRQIAKMMFLNSNWSSNLRNYLCKFYTAETFCKSLIKLFDQPI